MPVGTSGARAPAEGRYRARTLASAPPRGAVRVALIAHMVGRNEGDRYLRDVIGRLRTFADEIVFVDDASDDDTLTIARDLGCQAFASRWPTPHFPINEGELRHDAWQRLAGIAQPDDWILAVDADELLFGTERLADLTGQRRYDVLGVTFFHMWSPSQYRTDNQWRPAVGPRLFRYWPDGRFDTRPLAGGSTPTYVDTMIARGRVLWNTPLKMMHLGYLRDEDKLTKAHRYEALDHGRYHPGSHLESILDADPVLVDWDESAPTPRTDAAHQHWRRFQAWRRTRHGPD